MQGDHPLLELGGIIDFFGIGQFHFPQDGPRVTGCLSFYPGSGRASAAGRDEEDLSIQGGEEAVFDRRPGIGGLDVGAAGLAEGAAQVGLIEQEGEFFLEFRVGSGP